ECQGAQRLHSRSGSRGGRARLPWQTLNPLLARSHCNLLDCNGRYSQDRSMTPSPRKAELLDAVLEDLVAHGVASVSLRPMAARLGTSPRMLLFHFTSKEQLVCEALEALHARLQTSLAGMAAHKSDATAPLRQFWNWATSAQNLPYLRLIYETQMIAAANPE